MKIIGAALLCLTLALCGWAEPALRDLRLSAQSVACLDWLEVAFDLTGDFDNPFDPRQIEVNGHFTGPNGRKLVMPAFLYQDCQRRLGKQGEEVITAAGEPHWKIRFAPTQPGPWRVTVAARDRSGAKESPPLRFEATPAKGPGYIRRAPGTDYFQYDDGTAFFPIGENIAWAGKRGTFDFDDWLPAAGKSGMNLARIWLQWNQVLSIEHKGVGAGRYDLTNAWRMDYVLDLARRHGVRVLFTCDSPEPYQKEHYWLGKLTSKPWDNCPHNAANGGPLKEPNEFYTSDEGHRLIRQRLRYIVARWGWDPNLFCWELWNELNCFPGWDKLVPEIARWHVEMAGVLRKLDPYQHLVTTSFGYAEGHPDIWRLRELDFVQSHSYGSKDMALTLPAVTRAMKERYGRPHLIGEFGVPLTGAVLTNMAKVDPQGIHLRNAIWSTALGGGAGTALSWWWDNYIHPNNLYLAFTALAKYCEGVPWARANFKPVEATVAWLKPPPPRPPRDLVLACQGGQAIEGKVVLDPDQPPASLNRFYLYGRAQRDLQKPVLFELTRKTAGPLILRIGRVWVLGILEAKLDGQPILRQELPAGPGKGPWARSEFDKRWNIWGADYDQDITIEIPTGQHVVELFNAGRDGITIDRVTLPVYVTDERPPVRCIGLAGERLALLWLQNADHNFAALLEGRPVRPVAGAVVSLHNIPADLCQVEWWDTARGTILRTGRERTVKSRLGLELAPLATDVACKVRW